MTSPAWCLVLRNSGVRVRAFVRNVRSLTQHPVQSKLVRPILWKLLEKEPANCKVVEKKKVNQKAGS